jgi:HK97 family phage portal protein
VPPLRKRLNNPSGSNTVANFWQRLWARPQAKMDTLELFREVYGGRATWAAKDVTLQSAMQVSTALACGRVIAEGLAMLPWKVLRYHANGEIHEDASHPVSVLLGERPNPMQTAFEFVETLGLHLAFCGNAYVYAPPVGPNPEELWLLEPGWVTVKAEWRKLPTYSVRIGNGEAIPLTSAEVWHLRGPSWTSYAGMEFLSLARQALGLSMAIEEGQSKLHGQGVQMPGFYSVDGALTKEQHDKLRAWLEKEHAGSANAGRPMILDRASKWIATAMTNSDAQTLDQRKLQVEEVCRFMRVLPIMVGHADKTATYASAEQMMMAHAIYTLGPWARRLEQSANARLLSPADRREGRYTKLNEKAMQRMTARDQMDYLARAVLSGIMTRNEARAKLDMNALDGLDEPLAPANTFAGNPPSPSGSESGGARE